MKRFWMLIPLGILALAALRRPAPAPALALATTAPRAPRAAAARRTAGTVRLVVYVAGAVRRRGLYRLPAGARAGDAVTLAGGLSPSADPDAVDLAAPVTDGEEIRVPRLGEPARATARPPRTRSVRTRHKRATGVVDLNSADAQTLASLPGIGILLAQRIVEYRRLNGPFASTDELAGVAGVTARRLDSLQPYLRI